MRHRVHLHVVRGFAGARQYDGPILGTSRALAGFVDGMADWDIACPDEAKALTIKAIPGVAPFLMLHYRTPVLRISQFAGRSLGHPHDRHFATNLHSGAVIARPRGPLGAIVVRFRPETASQLLGEPPRHFLDAQIRLDDLFGRSQLSLLEERLSEARSSSHRFAHVERFLLAHLHPREDRPIACRAAALLSRRPLLRVRDLAGRLGVSERHLARSFNDTFGMGPKHFARIARIERVWSMRARGATWAEIAYAAGFADQAHMINDFAQIVGMSPGQLLGSEGKGRHPASAASATGSGVWFSW